MNNEKKYKLIGADGKEYLSEQKGTFGGHRKLKIYGRLDCPSALRHIAKGHYVHERVFFSDEATAIAAGYRPCAVYNGPRNPDHIFQKHREHGMIKKTQRRDKP